MSLRDGRRSTTEGASSKSIDRATLFAVGSAAMFGFGPVAVGYFDEISSLSGFGSSIRVTTGYFLAVYLVVAVLGALFRLPSLNLLRFWRTLSVRGRAFLAIGTVANAVSGWCFFDMLGRIDPLSASVIMALAIVFGFFASRTFLREEVGMSSAAGRRKWLSFLMIACGVGTTSLYAYLVSGSEGVGPVSGGILLVALASSLFAALRRVMIKGAMSDSPDSTRSSDPLVALPLAVTRFSYLYAFAFSLIAALIVAVVRPQSSATIVGFFMLRPFILVLGLLYGCAYALNYIALSRIEASRMALIAPSSTAFTGLYMTMGVLLFGYGRLPSLVQIPAALLVIFGAYLAARPGPSLPHFHATNSGR